MKLVFASHNQNKVQEIASLLPQEIELLSLTDIAFYDEIPETELTLEGNSRLKAKTIYSKTGMYCFADDTGLEVSALNNRPGVFSARFAGDQKNDNDNIQKLLSELESIPNRNARFRTVITLIINDEEFQFEGIVEGVIVSDKRGHSGFGYDPIFVPENENRTFAEMDLVEKNSFSHRARAFQKMIDFLTNKRA
jgi:XTP/dITP diphosphohydrolase